MMGSKFFKCAGFALTLLIGGISIPSVAYAADKPDSANQDWVIVLDDPRPARLKGWQRSQYSSSSGDYTQALELKRFGNRLAKRYDLELSAQWYIESLGVYCLIATFPKSESETLKKLELRDDVQWVQRSNDFVLLQEDSNLDKGASQIDTTIASDFSDPAELSLPKSIDGSGVVVAMIDSAVDDEHKDLDGLVEINTDFVNLEATSTAGEDHGTAIAGIIVADRESNIGVTGVAPGVTLKSFRGCWESDVKGAPNCSTLSLARALDAAIKSDAHIINLSLSGPKDLLLNRMIDTIAAKGATVVTAYDATRPNSDRFPWSEKGVLVVESAQSNQKKQNNTLDQGNKHLFSAPGARIVAAPNNRANFMQGHSIATAYTTGAIALCKQVEQQIGETVCSDLTLMGKGTQMPDSTSLINRLSELL